MLKITPIPAFNDNYFWVLHDTSEAWVVDPGAAAPVEAWLQEKTLELAGIFITHHHADHTGGLDDLLKQRTIPVYGPSTIANINHPVTNGSVVKALGCAFEVLAVPGHTLDHIAYFGQVAGLGPTLFCGDTLFAGGCGRLFEGSPAQMHGSLQKLAQLPPATGVYCAHEYTLANLKFALSADPGNASLKSRQEQALATRALGLPTLPSTIGLERDTNPFMRCEQAQIRQRAEAALLELAVPTSSSGEDEISTFALLRKWKDHFR